MGCDSYKSSTNFNWIDEKKMQTDSGAQGQYNSIENFMPNNVVNRLFNKKNF